MNELLNREQCIGCFYFRGGPGGLEVPNEQRFCHYMLHTGKRREVDAEGKCLSRLDRRQAMKERADHANT